MLASIILGLVAISLIVLGYLIWKKEKISLLHEYHYDKVLEEDKKAFCWRLYLSVFLEQANTMLLRHLVLFLFRVLHVSCEVSFWYKRNWIM